MTSMEQNLLESMLKERGEKIADLTASVREKEDAVADIQREINDATSQRHAQRDDNAFSIDVLRDEHNNERHRLQKHEREIKGGGRVHEYAALIRTANHEKVESSYVVRLQAQLCRVMHSLGVMESQKNYCSRQLSNVDQSHEG